MKIPELFGDFLCYNFDVKKYRPVAAVAVRRDDRWLLVRKPRKNHAWQFPQGGVDEGESLVNAAVRELREECGTDLQTKISPDPVTSYRYDFPVDFIRHHGAWDGAEVTFFEALWQSGEPQPDGEELVEARWCTSDKLRELVDPEYEKIIAQFL